MAQVRGTNRLDTGDAFPSMTLRLLDGSSLALPAEVQGEQSVLLFYRGEW